MFLRRHPLCADPFGMHGGRPVVATEVDHFLVPFLYGLGMVEAVPLETLQRLADPEDRDATSAFNCPLRKSSRLP